MMNERTDTSKMDETTMVFFMNATKLMSQLNCEGKSMAVEYMEYLLSTGKYSTENDQGSAWTPVFNSIHMA